MDKHQQSADGIGRRRAIGQLMGAAGLFREVGFGWIHGFWMMMGSGLVFGFGIELAMKHWEKTMKAAHPQVSQ